MSRVFLLLSVCFLFFENLLGQEQQQSLPSVEQISSKRTNYNLEEIKVRWKKAALENCPGVPCVVTPPAPSFTCGTSTVSDVDGNVYETVAIVGTTQCWTKTNLKVMSYNDGTPIPDLTSAGWPSTSGARAGYVAAGVIDYVGTFGYLYNWYAVNDPRKLCPAGWHVPTDSDWNIMLQTLDPSSVIINSTNVLTFTGSQSTLAGTVMKSQATNSSSGSGLGWNPGSPGTNTSGFSALPGGFRNLVVFFNSIRTNAFFWSATEFDGDLAWYRRLNNNNEIVNRFYFNKKSGASVRCLKDLSI